MQDGHNAAKSSGLFFTQNGRPADDMYINLWSSAQIILLVANAMVAYVHSVYSAKCLAKTVKIGLMVGDEWISYRVVVRTLPTWCYHCYGNDCVTKGFQIWEIDLGNMQHAGEDVYPDV